MQFNSIPSEQNLIVFENHFLLTDSLWESEPDTTYVHYE